jgi:hypothetical protein
MWGLIIYLIVNITLSIHSSIYSCFEANNLSCDIYNTQISTMGHYNQHCK